MKVITRKEWEAKQAALLRADAFRSKRRKARHYANRDNGSRPNPKSYCRPWTVARNREIAKAVSDT